MSVTSEFALGGNSLFGIVEAVSKHRRSRRGKDFMFCGASPGISPHQAKTGLAGSPRCRWNGTDCAS
jgi:hypothetical protein